MTTHEELKRSRISGIAILAAAILVSFVWHVIWFSVIKVASPSVSNQARMSRVSFLGALLAGVSMDARPAQRELKFLEKKYLASLRDPAGLNRVFGQFPVPRPDLPQGAPGEAQGVISRMVDEAVGAGKVEPGFEAE